MLLSGQTVRLCKHYMTRQDRSSTLILVWEGLRLYSVVIIMAVHVV